MKTRLFFNITLSVILILITVTLATADEIKRHGNTYVIYLPSHNSISEVSRSLESAIQGANWQVVGTLDIGASMKEFGLDIDNKVITACKSQYLARAIQENPYVSFIIPCRFSLFREPDDDGKGRIVVGFSDPVSEAIGLKISQTRAAAQARDELKTILKMIAEEYLE